MNAFLTVVRRLGALAVAFALLATTYLLAAQPASAASYTVKMGSDAGGLVFEPSVLKIKSGDTVKWVNNKAFPHNVVFDSKAPETIQKHSHKQLAAAPGIEFTETFDGVTPGEYEYFCVPHRGAGMVGKVIVE
jgi:plastocyanin